MDDVTSYYEDMCSYYKCLLSGGWQLSTCVVMHRIGTWADLFVVRIEDL